MKPGPAQATDAADIAVLLTELGYPTTAEQARERLARIDGLDDYATWVVREGSVGTDPDKPPPGAADAEEAVIGFAGGRLIWPFGKDEPDAQLAVLVVRHDRRGAGIGRMLVAEFDRWAAVHGAARAVVTSALRRTGAHEFYERIGFTYTGKRFGKTYPT